MYGRCLTKATFLQVSLDICYYDYYFDVYHFQPWALEDFARSHLYRRSLRIRPKMEEQISIATVAARKFVSKAKGKFIDKPSKIVDLL